MKNKETKELTKKILASCKKDFVLKVFTSVFSRMFLLIIPVIYSDAIDYATKSNFEKAYYFILISIVITILYYFFEMINIHAYYKLYRNIYGKFTKEAYESTINNSVYSLSRFSLGEYSNIVNTDVDIITTYYATTVMWVIRILEFAFIYFYFIYLNFNIFLITLFITVIMIIQMKLTGHKIQSYSDNRKRQADKKAATIMETFNGIKEIKGFHIFEEMNGKVENSCHEFLKADSKYNISSNNTRFEVQSVFEFVRLLSVLYGIYLFSKGQMEIGVILIIYNYYAKIIDSIGLISNISVERKNVRVSLMRYNKLLEHKQTNENVLYYPKKEYNGSITFQNVLYGNKLDPILDNVSFSIPACSFTVVTGRVGSGKTGIFDLLLKLNSKHEGEILIDANDIDQIDNETYYNLISSVRKRPIFFNTSIKENLLLVDSNLEKIEEICRKLNIHDEILKLSKGYDTNINSSNDKISTELK